MSALKTITLTALRANIFMVFNRVKNGEVYLVTRKDLPIAKVSPLSGNSCVWDGTIIALPFKDAVKLALAVEGVTREEFLKAQRRVRPGDSYKGYAEGLWRPWKAGGLLWLATRTDPQEIFEIYDLVLRAQGKADVAES